LIPEAGADAYQSAHVPHWTRHRSCTAPCKAYRTHVATALDATLARCSRLISTSLYTSMVHQSSRSCPLSPVYRDASHLGSFSVPHAVGHTSSATFATVGPKPSNSLSMVESCFTAQSVGMKVASTFRAYDVPDNAQEVLLGANLPLPLCCVIRPSVRACAAGRRRPPKKIGPGSGEQIRTIRLCFSQTPASPLVLALSADWNSSAT
jgi:hypothetical protein